MRYVILLRGVNVGGRVIKMAELKACLEQHGFVNVLTILQSGNVLVDSNESDTKKLQAQVEDMLSEVFEYPAQVTVLPVAELIRIVNEYPFPDAPDDMHRYVIFIQGPAKTLSDAATPDASVEAVEPSDGVVYWRVLKGRTLDSAFAKQLARYATKNFATNRNLNTLQKIITKA